MYAGCGKTDSGKLYFHFLFIGILQKTFFLLTDNNYSHNIRLSSSIATNCDIFDKYLDSK